jgi:hypothetical protein
LVHEQALPRLAAEEIAFGERRAVVREFGFRPDERDPGARDAFLQKGGDGGGAGDPFGNAQDLSTLLGSILRLDVSGDGYEIPPDNPFMDRPGARPEIYAYGLRNPWRFSFDRESGELWAGDVGQNRWEETNRIVAGGNYGWDILEGFECFQTPDCETGGLIAPRSVYALDGECAVIGGYVYRGSALPELDGWFVYGDFCSGKIWAVNTADAMIGYREGVLEHFGKVAARLDDLRLETLSEGRCVQTLHVGSFDDEADVLARMHHEFIPDSGLRMAGTHHEIYLSDARRTAPERMRTILRQPVAPATSSAGGS